MSQVEQLLRAYSSQPDRLVLARAYPGECSMPDMQLLTVPTNALGIEAAALLTTIEQRIQQKGKKPYRKVSEFLLVHRVLEKVEQATADTPQMLGVLNLIPDCSHSHLVLELNILAFLLKLPATVQLGCYVHHSTTDLRQPPVKPELIMAQRVPDIIKTLLNDAFQQGRRSVQPRDSQAGNSTSKHELGAAEHEGAGRAGLPGPTGNVSDIALQELASASDSRTGSSDPADNATPSRAPQVQQVRRRLQQQELF